MTFTHSHFRSSPLPSCGKPAAVPDSIQADTAALSPLGGEEKILGSRRLTPERTFAASVPQQPPELMV